MDENNIMQDTFLHIGEKRHSRLKGYYICGMGCSNQFIFNRPLRTRQCPVCHKELTLLEKVDEFEINRMKKWSEGTIIIEDEKKERSIA